MERLLIYRCQYCGHEIKIDKNDSEVQTMTHKCSKYECSEVVGFYQLVGYVEIM